MRAKGAAAGGHGSEELAELAREVGGSSLIEFDHLPEKMIGQKSDAVSKETEEQAHKEMRRALRVNAALL